MSHCWSSLSCFQLVIALDQIVCWPAPYIAWSFYFFVIFTTCLNVQSLWSTCFFFLHHSYSAVLFFFPLGGGVHHPVFSFFFNELQAQVALCSTRFCVGFLTAFWFTAVWCSNYMLCKEAPSFVCKEADISRCLVQKNNYTVFVSM